MAMRAFYYRVERGSRVLFGTEAKQILAAPDVLARVFEPVVGAYLAGCFGPLEWSFYAGISQLAPAHALVVDEDGCHTWRYWDVDPNFSVEYSSEDEYVEHFLEIFEEAVRYRLRSTKPVGIFLSGGSTRAVLLQWLGRCFNERGRLFLPRFVLIAGPGKNCRGAMSAISAAALQSIMAFPLPSYQ